MSEVFFIDRNGFPPSEYVSPDLIRLREEL